MSSTAVQEIEMEEVEELLIRIGIRPEWLHVHRIINMKYVVVVVVCMCL